MEQFDYASRANRVFSICMILIALLELWFWLAKDYFPTHEDLSDRREYCRMR